MRKAKKDKAQLTEKEEEVMLYFWNHGELRVKDVVDLMPEPKPHVNTISTFVRLLEQKGYLGHNSHGNTYTYYPLRPMEEYRRNTFRNIVRNFFNNNYMTAVSAFVEDEQLNADELRQLLDMVEKRNK